MKTIHFLLAICITNGLIICITSGDTQEAIQQSKEHHERYHNLLIENHMYKQWYENWLNDSDCDTFGKSGDITINCEKN